MATTFNVQFVNSTPQAWTFAVFVLLPASIGLDNVAWKAVPVAPNGGRQSAGWTEDLDAVIGTRQQKDGAVVYSDTQALSTFADQAWKIVNGTVQQLTADGKPLTPGTIQINNQSGAVANAALGIAGTGAVYKGGLFSGANVAFVPQPSYYVLISDSMVAGQVITVGSRLPPRVSGWSTGKAAATFVGPTPLGLSSAVTSAMVTAKVEGSSITLTVQN